MEVLVIGGGLAGCEAAWQLAEREIRVKLYEMRPCTKNPIHKTDYLAELVCSNSLGSLTEGSAPGLLKQELKALKSLLIDCALKASVPAGSALAVDRDIFAGLITERIHTHPFIEVIRSEVSSIPESPFVIVATGPLTSPSLAQDIKKLTGDEDLYFFDAVSPIITRDSLDLNIIFTANRYDKGGDSSYLNCPMTKEQYDVFYNTLLQSERAELKDFEKDTKYFESCLPVEVIASRGYDTLRFGPMKPVGLVDPRYDKIPFAVVQLRQDNTCATLYNLVGFQTNLKWGAQKELLKTIPGLENVEVVRYGVMHRNIYINSPKVLKHNLESRSQEGLFFAGQITGVEGYTESVATGLLAAINCFCKMKNLPPLVLPDISMLGSLIKFITDENRQKLDPMNSNWGIVKPLEVKIKSKKERNLAYYNRGIDFIKGMKDVYSQVI